MAKKELSKSAVIKDYLAKNPEAKPAAVVEALAAKSVKVSPGLVSAVKTKLTGSKAKKGRKARAGGSLVQQLQAEKESLEKRLAAIDTLLG